MSLYGYLIKKLYQNLFFSSARPLADSEVKEKETKNASAANESNQNKASKSPFNFFFVFFMLIYYFTQVSKLFCSGKSCG